MSDAQRLHPHRWALCARAVTLAFFPKRCLACTAPLADPGAHHLCWVCVEGLVYNDGPRCAHCDLPRGHRHCPNCPAANAAFVSLRAPLLYSGVVRELVRRGKFCGQHTVWTALGRILAADPLAQRAARPDVTVVCVPLAGRRAIDRGYNQSAILARTLAHLWQRPVRYWLRRGHQTSAQSGLPHRLRQTNVQDAFFCPQPVQGRVVLVDDVVTSGATLQQAAGALRQAGASTVQAVAVARTPRL